MPRPATVLKPYPFAVRLLSIFVAWSLTVPCGYAGGLWERGEAPFPKAIGAPFVPESIDPEPYALPPQDQPPPSLGIGKCADVSRQHPEPPSVHPRNNQADDWGEITVAQPKIWKFERVSALLDGLLRDVEGVSLSDLTQLNPNAQNAAALKFIQSALEVGVQYDQAAAVTNAINRGNFQLQREAQLQRFQADNAYIELLVRQRDIETAQLLAAQNTVNALQPLADAKTITKEQQEQLDIANARVKSLTTSLGTINDSIGKASLSSLAAAPSLQNTTVGTPASGSTMSSTLSGFADVLKNLPQGLQDNLGAALKSPTFPATKQLDNFITLLYERLAREVSVLQDDLTRDPDNEAFLLQFDVGLYPSKKASDHVARVEFDLNCPGCKVYSLYPGQSAYNLANYSGASKRNSFWGNIATLFGFGLSASYRRQVDTLEGSLVQSVYTAGFLNGVLAGDSSRPKISHAPSAPQSFGWYYGPAPFEKLVSPGIRSTFALVTVPRSRIEKFQDGFGNVDACVDFQINGVWTSRNNPLFQQTSFSFLRDIGEVLVSPAYVSNTSRALSSGNDFDTSVVNQRAIVKLPAPMDDVPLVARREKQKLHVIRMEYNTVYGQPEIAPATTSVQTVVQTLSQTTNQTTGQTAGQTATQTTGTAVSLNNAASGGAVPSTSSSLEPLPCPKGKCAAILLKLDRAIDPNLVVTVRGQPLLRVRDWRGRATSVLPPAQSGTDLAGTLSAAGSTTLGQLQKSRSLLESDQFLPNMWFALNSHELLLNVSVDVATNEEFPVIQLADPSGSFVIPHDLRRNITDLIVNGFRMRSQTEASIQREVARQNWRDESQIDPFPILPDSGDAPVSSGPYPFSTFLPLFSPEPAGRSFFAAVGETAEDLLIGFLPQPADKDGAEGTRHYNWLGTRAQVILEDHDLDFAWSLICDEQGEFLVCRLPIQEISRAYLNFLRACPSIEECPGLDPRSLPLVHSLDVTLTNFMAPPSASLSPGQNDIDDRSLKSSARPSHSGHPTDEGELRTLRVAFRRNPVVEGADEAKSDNLDENVRQKETDRKNKELRKRCRSNLLSSLDDLSKIKNAFVSTLQLSLEQSDPHGKDIFYSPEPARIGFLPLSEDYRDAPFKPWQFDYADSDNVIIRGCNYWPGSEPEKIQVSLLGVPSWPKPEKINPKRPGWLPLAPDKNDPTCALFDLPTAALANDPVVFIMEFPGDTKATKDQTTVMEFPTDTKATKATKNQTTVTIARARLAPHFGRPEVRVLSRSPELKPLKWEVKFPVERAVYNDLKGLTDALQSLTSVTANWVDGDRTIQNTETETEHPTFMDDERNGRVSLVVTMDRKGLAELPKELHLIRQSGASGIQVATLPDLRRLLLPYKLTLDTLSGTQFALRGENAGIIDAVAVGNGTAGDTFAAASGYGFAIVTLPKPSSSTAGPKTTDSGVASDNSTKIIITTSPTNSAHLDVSTQNKSTPAKPPSSDESSPNLANTAGKKATKPLDSGTYAVVPLILIAPDQSKPDEKKKTADAVAADEQNLKKAQDAWNAAAQKDKDAKKKVVDSAAANLAKDKAAAAKAALAAEPSPNYMPLEVKDEKGKSLTFTIPEPAKKPDTTTPPPTACAVPCVLAPCAATCPPASKPAATTP